MPTEERGPEIDMSAVESQPAVDPALTEAPRPEPLKIRRANLTDLVQLAGVLMQAAVEKKRECGFYSLPHPPRTMHFLVEAIQNELVAVAVDEGRIAGSIGMLRGNEPWATDDSVVWQNEWFYVVPDYRTTDLAERLLQYSEQMVEWWAEQNGDDLPVLFGTYGPRAEVVGELLERRGYTMMGANYVLVGGGERVEDEEDVDDSAVRDTVVAGGGQ